MARDIVSRQALMALIIDYGAVKAADAYALAQSGDFAAYSDDTERLELLESITVQIERLYADREEE
jgi:hypothetical protein